MKTISNIADITMDTLRYIESRGVLEDGYSFNINEIEKYLYCNYDRRSINFPLSKFMHKLNSNVTRSEMFDDVAAYTVDILFMSDVLLLALAFENYFNKINSVKYEYTCSKYGDKVFDANNRSYYKNNKDFEQVEDDIRNFKIELASYKGKLFIVFNIIVDRDLREKYELFSYGNRISICIDGDNVTSIILSHYPNYGIDVIYN